MKKLIAFLATATLAWQAQAADGDMSHNAEFLLRHTVNQDADLNADAKPSTSDTTEHVLSFGMNYRSGEKMSAHLGLVHYSNWGANADNDGGTSDTSGKYDSESVQNGLLVNEAYAKWMATDEFSMKFGRSNYQIADGSVIGNNAWDTINTSFEGVWAGYDTEFAKFTLLGLQTQEFVTTVGSSDDEASIVGLSVDFSSLGDFLKAANLHYLAISSDATGTAAHMSDTRYGLHLAGDTMNIDYRLNYATLSGENETTAGVKSDNSGDMMEVEVGYTLPDVNNLRVSIYYHVDAGDSDAGQSDDDGDDESYSGFFYNTHDNAGLMDVISWGNLTDMAISVSADATDDISVALAYHMFSLSEEDDLTNSPLSTGSRVADEDDIGSEIDLTIAKKYSDNFMITFRYGTFEPGDAFDDGAGGDLDSQTQYFLEGKMNF